MGVNGTRSIGTILMAVGLVLILSVGGYFAWTEVQAAQVRSELEQSAAEAAARSTRIASAGAEATPSPSPPEQSNSSSARPAADAKAALTATQSPILPEPSVTRAPKATATRLSNVAARVVANATARPTATRVATATALPPSPTPPPTAAVVAPPLVPVRLAIPDLKIDTKVVEMGWEVVQTKSGPASQWVIPRNAAGHHVNSAGIGQLENLVISGHNNIYGRVFMPISQAWNNDTKVKVDDFTDKSNALDGRLIQLFDVAGGQHNYVITEFYRLKDTGVSQQQREANGRYIMPSGDERVTIVTCWPPTNNTHRLVVVARPEK